MDITLIILHYLKEVLKDKKFYILVVISAFLVLLSWYALTQSVIAYFLVVFIQSFLVHNYAILTISTIYYTKSPEEMGRELRNLPFKALFNPQVMGVSVGIVLGEVLVGGALGVLLALVSMVAGKGGMFLVLILFIYWLIGKEGKALGSNSAGEGFRALISLLYDFRFWKKSFNGVYLNIFFFALFILIFSMIIISAILKFFPFLPLTLLISGFYFVAFSIFLGISGYFANKSVDGLENNG
jgi:hypothetical protein